MKKITFLILIIFCINDTINSQWVKINYSLNMASGCFFIDKNTGYSGDFGKIYRTTNGGNNWQLLSSLGVDEGPTTIKFINNSTGFLTASERYGYYTPSYIFKTTNAGLNWSIKYTFNDVLFDIVCYNNSIYVSGSHSVFLRSTDTGEVWQVISQIPADTFSYVHLSFINANTGFAAGNLLDMYGGERVLKTTNGGVNWTSLPPPYMDNITQIQFLDENTGYVLKWYALWKTTNGGNNFSQIGYWNNNTDKWDIKFINYNIGWMTEGGQENDVVHVTTNGGINWTIQLDTLTYSVAGCGRIYGNDSILIAGAWENSYKTTNGGGLFPYVSGIVMYDDNNQPVTSGWVKAIKLDSLSNSITVIDSARIQSNGAYTIYGLPSVELDFMAYEDDELDFAPTYYDTTIFWKHAITITPTINLNNIDIFVKRINNSGNNTRHISGIVSSGNDITGLNDAVVYARIDSSYKNYDISSSNGYFYVDSLQDGSYSLIVDRMGYLPSTINVTLSGANIENLNIPLMSILKLTNISSEIPIKYALSNYPNPFNPATTILFDILKQENVKLTIYGILGEEIKTFVHDKLNAGKYKIVFDGSGLATGVYFYRLETENYSETRKMVLLK